MEVSCKNCGALFNKSPYAIKSSPNHFCSRSCAAKINNKTHPKRQKEGVCIHCNAATSASRQKCVKCIERSKLISGAKRITTCTKRDRSFEKDLCSCGNNKRKCSQKCSLCVSEDSLNKTKIEMEYLNIGNRASRWSRIREHARKVAAESGILQKPCAKCGFADHVEICHIKSISAFLDTDPVRDINSVTNLVQLCPNCHWLFDHGKINL